MYFRTGQFLGDSVQFTLPYESQGWKSPGLIDSMSFLL
ncbi:hypothetical protein PEDI_56270 [Persicobacter diffluens]|uniref:Uncharacterized protein n=1 Tax=Persicobacter diffluens TaxID=981 RepID=A0AAN4W3E2_9BACT|nr:hypothetical protein PEDI_51350 [Persicobacter diffluens]GJM65075.1 hypothetical protein PEDI_56270 [Persicobacter diffluens]